MKAQNSRKAHGKKTNHMTAETFADLEKALEDALAFERGERRDLHVTRIQAAHPMAGDLGEDRHTSDD